MKRCVATSVCVALLALLVTGGAWATSVPAYTCVPLGTTMPGYGSSGGSQGWSLLSNGTVVGDFPDVQGGGGDGPPGLPFVEAVSWNTSGTATLIGNVGTGPDYAFGDDYGRCSLDSYNKTYIWNGSSFVQNATIGSGSSWGETENGLVLGSAASGAGYAYDLNTSTLYTFGPASATYPNGGNASGFVVGQDGSGTKGFIWNEGTQTYTTLPAFNMAWGVSNNSTAIAGQSASGSAAVSNLSGTIQNTYWAGRATFVNNNGIVVGDTSTGWSTSGVAMAYFPGYGQVNLTTAYAPNGVSFNYCAGLNDSGDILVWDGGQIGGNLNGGVTSYLLVPTVTPEPSTLVLLGAGLTGLLAYAWRKRK